MNRRRLLCPECHLELRYSDVKGGTCPHCKAKICIPKSYFRPGGIVGAIAAIWFLVENYRRMLNPSIGGVAFVLWFVALFGLWAAATFLSSMVLIYLFPPLVERAYVNDTFTTLRLDE
jgi:hypothetical protein